MKWVLARCQRRRDKVKLNWCEIRSDYMRDDCSTILLLHRQHPIATQISGIHQGIIIIVSCAACLIPVELFLVEIWGRHGVSSLLFFVLPLVTAWLIARVLPERYYQIKTFESSGWMYEAIGIRFFKRFVPNGDYINRTIRRFQPDYRLVSDERSMVQFEAGTRLAERCHLVSLLLVLPSASYALMLGWTGFAVWILLPNIPLHLYPVLLQRYTRARLQRVRMRSKIAPMRL